MRSLLAIALLALFAVTFAGCAEDPERYPNGVPTTSTSRSGSASATRTGTSSASSSMTSTGPDVNASNEAPTANLTAAPSNGTAPLNVTFSLSGSDADNDTLSWTLAFGDGNQTNGTTLPSSVVHSYAAARNYTASLTVSDGSLNRTATARITVGGAGAPSEPTPEDLCPTDPLAIGHETAGYYATPADNAAAPGSLWIYEESNGMPGLQRNDDTVRTECPTPDTIIL
ncbi:MAG: PKD domain-containing protein [Thermoplasmatota archaeon]